MKDVEVCLPICVGTVSFWLGKKADEYHSHKWTVYVRSPVNEDLSPVVKKVSEEEREKKRERERVVDWKGCYAICHDSHQLHLSLRKSILLLLLLLLE